MLVTNDLTRDGRLKIVQDTDYGSYTLDSLLLADFVKLTKRSEYAIDLCAGNGPIGMLMADRKANLKVEIVEIQKQLSDITRESVKLNNLEDRVNIHNRDLKGITDLLGKNKYHIITVNPPYFKVTEDANINPNQAVAMARHELTVTLEDIIKESSLLLDNIGTINLVFRPQRLDELIILLNKYGFTLKRIKFVYPKIGKDCNTILVEAKRGKSDNQMVIEPPFIVYNDNNEYTEATQTILNY
ncbi:tRNA1(Val) (adenine(37)-N6)-methyltransferase [Mollicutes bacterium LVI A0039]|nr:tRNA1(Val) (adenine(37)-N6)-methyltransferase [Mollicutes bacterium LVI A0039]